MSFLTTVKDFFRDRFKDNESRFASAFYLLGWGLAITFLALHYFGTFVSSSEGFALEDAIWVLSIPATFSSIGQYIGRAADGLFSQNKKANNERIASLVGAILAIGFVVVANHFYYDGSNFTPEPSDISINWEYLAFTMPILANTVVAGCGYIGRVFDYFTRELTILDVFRWLKAKITNDKSVSLNIPAPPPEISNNLNAVSTLRAKFFKSVGNYFKETFNRQIFSKVGNYIQESLPTNESRFRVLGLVIGIALGIALIVTGTALLPFSGGSSVILHVAACALFVFISGRSFASIGKYVGKAADCLAPTTKLADGQKPKPDNEQIASLMGIGIGLVISIVAIPLHFTGVSLLLPKIAEKTWAYASIGAPLLINNVASGCGYLGRFIDHLTKKKTYIDLVYWAKNKIFPKKVAEKSSEEEILSQGNRASTPILKPIPAVGSDVIFIAPTDRAQTCSTSDMLTGLSGIPRKEEPDNIVEREVEPEMIMTDVHQSSPSQSPMATEQDTESVLECGIRCQP